MDTFAVSFQFDLGNKVVLKHAKVPRPAEFVVRKQVFAKDHKNSSDVWYELELLHHSGDAPGKEDFFMVREDDLMDLEHWKVNQRLGFDDKQATFDFTIKDGRSFFNPTRNEPTFK